MHILYNISWQGSQLHACTFTVPVTIPVSITLSLTLHTPTLHIPRITYLIMRCIMFIPNQILLQGLHSCVIPAMAFLRWSNIMKCINLNRLTVGLVFEQFDSWVLIWRDWIWYISILQRLACYTKILVISCRRPYLQAEVARLKHDLLWPGHLGGCALLLGGLPTPWVASEHHAHKHPAIHLHLTNMVSPS